MLSNIYEISLVDYDEQEHIILDAELSLDKFWWESLYDRTRSNYEFNYQDLNFLSFYDEDYFNIETDIYIKDDIFFDLLNYDIYNNYLGYNAKYKQIKNNINTDDDNMKKKYKYIKKH